MTKLWKWLLLVLILSSSFTCYADDTNDLLKLYDLEQTVGDREIYSDFEESKSEYDTALKNAELDEDYNAILEFTNGYVDEQVAVIEKEVTKLLEFNKRIADDISNAFDSDDLSKLIEYDAMYKQNINQVNRLLRQKDKCTKLERNNIDYGYLAETEQEFLTIQQAYRGTIDTMELGDVLKAKYPLNADTEVVNDFGNIVDPISKTGIIDHSGIDLKADFGTEVLAQFDGIVNTTGYGPLSGYYVSIYHGSDIITYYCHLSRINCKIGDTVSQYDVIGLSGDSGEDTKVPLLHFGIYYKNNRLDPLILFGGRDG